MQSEERRIVEINRTPIYGWELALEGMRNSRESWNSSDTEYSGYNPTKTGWQPSSEWLDMTCREAPTIGETDLKLCRRLIRAGSPDRKFLRQIYVWVNMKLPRYIWTELDTYNIGPTRNSTSTMDTLGKRALRRSDFQDGEVLRDTLDTINIMSDCYSSNMPYYWISPVDGKRIILKGYDIIRKMKRLLPEGFLLLSTMTFNYENLLNIYFQRRSHRLAEWGEICSWIENLPYMREFLQFAKSNKNIVRENIIELNNLIHQLRNDVLNQSRTTREIALTLNDIGIYIEDNLL